ncbi:MAG: GNAT family N-acetyltransferase [Acetobacteraceae bacterium]|nr:GNAT family N-acetyltransferase [Acetobacteraceae bacterium]
MASAPIHAVRERFSVQLANTAELAREAHRLRYQVYCVENDYLEGDGLEVDEFDIHSHQVVLRDNQSSQVVGTARLVLFREETPDHSFPMQEVTPVSLHRYVPLHTTAEVSRFAISKRQRNQVGTSAGLLRLALVQGLVRLSTELGITHWVAVMEPSLLRLLKSSAIYFNEIGWAIEYHGLRQPCYASVEALLARVHDEKPDLWGLLTDNGRLWPEPDHRAAA